METWLILKIQNDEKVHEYLVNHSSWYRLLNRDSNYYDKLINEYKKNKRENSMNKFNETIDNIDLVTNVLKMM